MSHVDYSRLPHHMQDGARLYVEKGIRAGSFFTAVVSNDFLGAFQKADDMNTRAMRDWAVWLHNEAPRVCHGSPEAVEEWIAHRGLAGLANEETQ